MCPDCDRWRTAGREVGRTLGVASERKRLSELFESRRLLALSRCSINEANVWAAAHALIREKNV